MRPPAIPAEKREGSVVSALCSFCPPPGVENVMFVATHRTRGGGMKGEWLIALSSVHNYDCDATATATTVQRAVTATEPVSHRVTPQLRHISIY